ASPRRPRIGGHATLGRRSPQGHRHAGRRWQATLSRHGAACPRGGRSSVCRSHGRRAGGPPLRDAQALREHIRLRADGRRSRLRGAPARLSVDWQSPYPERRFPIFARNVVATTQPLAAQAGLAMLRGGGNAVDAALAAAITLTVVEPIMNGIGGDLYAMVWCDGQLHGLDSTGAAPAGWTPARF